MHCMRFGIHADNVMIRDCNVAIGPVESGSKLPGAAVSRALWPAAPLFMNVSPAQRERST